MSDSTGREALRSALERLLWQFRLSLAGRPVICADEAIAEAEHALNQAPQPQQAPLSGSLDLNEAREKLHATIDRLAEDAPSPPVGRQEAIHEGAPLTDSYVQRVPDKCDRIVWRGSYYSLPIAAAPTPPERAK